MQTEHAFFYCEELAAPIAYSLFLPECEPRGIVQISHGMCEYIGRYSQFAAFLCQNGYVVCGHDHPGHGASAPSPDRLGYFAAQDGPLLLSQALRQMTRLIKERFPGLPVILLGHSMGSFVARDYMARYPREASGVILMGTGADHPALLTGAGLADLVIASKGRFYRSELLRRLAFGRFNARYANAATPFDWLSRDPREVSLYMQDPWCNFCFTATGFRDLFRLIHHVNQTAWLMMTPRRTPLLLLSGAMDPVGGYGSGVTRVYQQLVEAGCERVSLKLYPKARHELLHELCRQEVFSDILHWIQALAG